MTMVRESRNGKGHMSGARVSEEIAGDIEDGDNNGTYVPCFIWAHSFDSYCILGGHDSIFGSGCKNGF